MVAQSSQVNDPAQLLLEVRKRVVLTVTSLPKHLCTETIERTTFLPRDAVVHPSCDDLVSRKRQRDPGRVSKYTADRLRLDVTIFGDNELFSWAGENHFEDKSLANLIAGGATSTGAFATLLGSIFGNNSTTFTFNGQAKANGAGLVEYGYQVPLNKSLYTIGNGETNATVAFEGTFSVDPSTFKLVTLYVHADQIPPQLHVCDDTTRLEYGVVSLHGSDFLLPQRVNWRIVNDDGTELENDTVFSACREFRGESSLSFGAATSESVETEKSHSQLDSLPAGMKFKIALAQPIEVAHAAGGDSVKATLISPLRDKRHKVLIANGAIITARILRIERIYGAKSEDLKLAIRAETVEANGAVATFHAKLDPVTKNHDIIPTPSPDDSLTVRQPLGTFGEMVDSSSDDVGVIHFEDVTDDFVIKRGLEIAGVTIGH